MKYRLAIAAALVAATAGAAGVAGAQPMKPPPPPTPVPIIPIPPPNGPVPPPKDLPPPPPTNHPDQPKDTGKPTGDMPPPPDGVSGGSGTGSGTGSGAGAGAGAHDGSGSGSGSGGPDADRPTGDVTAADAAGAPVPGAESGRTDEVDPGDSTLRVIGRGVLFVPKTLYQIVFLPVYGAFYAIDRYHVDELYNKWFFNANHTIGLVPTGTYVSGIGPTVGLRFQMADVFGERESFAVQGTTGAALGDPYREQAEIDLNTGHRLGHHFALSMTADIDRRPEDAFYGIGNGNLQAAPPPAPVNVQTNDYAYEVHNRYQEARVGITGDLHPTDELHALVTGAITDLSYSPSVGYDAVPFTQVYNTANVPGFIGGVQHVYGELELRYDTRHRATLWEPIKMYSGGSLVAAYAGRVDRIDGGADFWRYGGELQHYFRLGRGPRTLITRIRAQGVTGDITQVPFSELPELGGADFLRGYSYNRFRDRASVMGTVQYSWDLSYFVDAYLFADVGRVYDSFDDLTIHGQRVGYGVGIDLHGDTGLLTTMSFGSSSDGGFVFNIAFNPSVDARTRWR